MQQRDKDQDKGKHKLANIRKEILIHCAVGTAAVCNELY